MSDAWYAAFFLLALLGLVNALLLVAVMRQVGVLHQRVRPTGAGQHEGPELGSQAKRLEFEFVGPAGRRDPFSAPITVLGYISPQCELCDELVKIVRAYRRSSDEDLIDVFFATDASVADAAEWLKDRQETVPLVRHPDIRREYSVPGSPYLLAFTPDGDDLVKVLGGGVVNTLEQFEDALAQSTTNYLGLHSGSAPDEGEMTNDDGTPEAKVITVRTLGNGNQDRGEAIRIEGKPRAKWQREKRR